MFSFGHVLLVGSSSSYLESGIGLEIYIFSVYFRKTIIGTCTETIYIFCVFSPSLEFEKIA